jgi:hypothetical protein
MAARRPGRSVARTVPHSVKEDSVRHAATAVSQSPARASVALWAARILLGLLGVSIVFGSIYFSFFALPEDGGVSGPVDWVVAAWALAVGLGMVAVAVRLGAPGTMRIAVGLVLAHVAFGLVKLVGYGETEALGLFGVDLVILAVLAAASRPRR